MADIDKNREFLTRLWCLENDDRPAFLIGFLGPRVRGGRPVRSALFSTEGEGTVRDRLLDPAKFLEAQLVEINDQMAYQGDFVPCLCPAFGVINIPAAFGCEVIWREGNFPSVRPLPLSDPAAIHDLPRPTISSGETGRILETTRFFIEKTAGRIPIRWMKRYRFINTPGWSPSASVITTPARSAISFNIGPIVADSSAL